MARITVEDCLKNVDNRFALIHLAAKRVRQLRKGAEPLVVCKNKDIVVALREIAANKIFQADTDQPYELELDDTEGIGIQELGEGLGEMEEEEKEALASEDEEALEPEDDGNEETAPDDEEEGNLESEDEEL